DRETNRLCSEMVAIVDEKVQFLQQLDALPGRLVLKNMVDFLRETQNKDTHRMLQLQILGRKAEFRARVNEHFIHKLKGVVPF
ncbi:hypothetical protein Tco_0816636, partial [Tanacetum coccineum]